MDVKSILTGLQGALSAAQALAPALTALGVPGVAQAAQIASAALQIANDVSEAVKTGQVIVTSDDEAELQAILAQLQTENDALAAKIAAS